MEAEGASCCQPEASFVGLEKAALVEFRSPLSALARKLVGNVGVHAKVGGNGTGAGAGCCCSCATLVVFERRSLPPRPAVRWALGVTWRVCLRGGFLLMRLLFELEGACGSTWLWSARCRSWPGAFGSAEAIAEEGECGLTESAEARSAPDDRTLPKWEEGACCGGGGGGGGSGWLGGCCCCCV